jgi:hypothetical protein
VSAPAPLITRPTEHGLAVEEGLGLVELLDLLGLPADTAAADTPAVPAELSELAARVVALPEVLRGWSRRAAGWGAGPEGAFRAW